MAQVLKDSKSNLKSAVFDYFLVSEDKKHYVCQCQAKNARAEEEVCGSRFSTYSSSAKHGPTRASNLKRHLQRFHPEVLKIVNEKDTEKASEPISNPDPSSSSQPNISKYFINTKVTVSMTAETFKRCIVEMVVKDGVPLSFFSKSAFVGLNGEMASKLDISLSYSSIRNMVIEEANEHKNELKRLLQGKFLFLKMDACTRHRINYFAINIQFLNDAKVVTHCLAVKDTDAQHSSDYLQKLVMDVLKEFGIEKKQVLLIVTDNASNMISTIEKLNQDQENEQSEESDNSNEDEMDEIIVGEDYENLDNFVETTAKLSEIHHMRCAVHTLQLAIRDGLKQTHAANLVGRVRKIAVAARTPKLDAILKQRAGKGTVLDQATRWGSTYLMIQRVLELQPFLTDMANPDVTMTDALWDEVKGLEALLRHPFLTTKNLQAAELTPGSFMKEWKTLSFRLSHIGGLIAEDILYSMQRREASLLDNDILLAGVYVDPMYRVTLTEDQKRRAVTGLFDVAVRMKSQDLESHNITQRQKASSSEACSLLTGNEGRDRDVEIDFERHLDIQEQSKRQRLEEDEATPSPLAKFRLDFSLAVKEMEKIDRSLKVTVKEAFPLYPEIIKDAAMTVTALPPTQVSVEQLFSALRIIKSDLRASLKEDIIEAILFLRTNFFFKS